MTDYCCVTACGKSRAQAGSLFTFPRNNDTRQKWINVIKSVQPNWIPGARPYICIDHFTSSDIITETKRIHRRRSAVPSQFNSVSSNIQVTIPENSAPLLVDNVPVTIDPCNGCPSAQENARIDQLNNDLLTQDLVTQFATLKNEYKTNLDFNGFSVAELDESLIFYKFKENASFGIVFKLRIVITKDMYVKVFLFEKELPKKEIKMGSMTNSMKVTYWSQLQNIVTRCRNMSEVPDDDFAELIGKSVTTLESARNCKDEDKKDEKEDILICIIKNQLENLIRPKPKYNAETLLFAFICFNQSPEGYKRLREHFTLPHESYLRHISGNLNVTLDKNENTAYLKTITRDLSELEKKAKVKRRLQRRRIMLCYTPPEH
ncbi:hypothetical protein DMENIID0001_097680 [Sergentomyia squamirostris]